MHGVYGAKEVAWLVCCWVLGLRYWLANCQSAYDGTQLGLKREKEKQGLRFSFSIAYTLPVVAGSSFPALWAAADGRGRRRVIASTGEHDSADVVVGSGGQPGQREPAVYGIVVLAGVIGKVVPAHRFRAR